MNEGGLTDYSKPTPILVDFVASLNPGTALDAGCGNGRNSVYLAQKGWSVTAIDTDQEVIKQLNKVLKKENLNIKTYQQDLRDSDSNIKFDLVVCLMMLHFLPQKDIKPVIESLKAKTKIGGINIVTVFTNENPNGIRPYLFAPNELREFYKDWQIETYKEGDSSMVIPPDAKEPVSYKTARLTAIKK